MGGALEVQQEMFAWRRKANDSQGRCSKVVYFCVECKGEKGTERHVGTALLFNQKQPPRLMTEWLFGLPLRICIVRY